MKSAVTISLVEEARGGPFIFWGRLAEACARAAELGFDAVEIFAPGPDVLESQFLHPDLGPTGLQGVLDHHKLQLAAVGTGAGMVMHGLNLCDPDAGRRQEALTFIRSMIDAGAAFGAPAILGSMQGRWGRSVDREAGLQYLREGLNACGRHAQNKGVRFIYEPLNRYETNLINTIEDGVGMLESLETDNVTLLADLFHMNIEEADLAEAIRLGRQNIGHVHFVDSQRRPAGLGHMDYAPIMQALREIGYEGYLCAEAFPYPDPDAAAQQTMKMFRQLTG